MSGLKDSVGYSRAFKIMVLNEVRSGSISKTEASRKYGIKGHSTISKWMRKLDEKKPKLDLMKPLEQSSYESRIRELEAALAHEKLRSKALEEMINIAESELKIQIKKKLDTKQSKR